MEQVPKQNLMKTNGSLVNTIVFFYYIKKIKLG